MKCKSTNKLFFRKYIYKIAVDTPVARFFKKNRMHVTRAHLVIISDKLKSSKSERITLSPYSRNLVGSEDISTAYDIINFLEVASEYHLRIEGSILGIYSNDISLVDSIKKIKNIKIEEISIPDDINQGQFLLEHPNTILRKEYSHKYKVTIKPLWGENNNFLSWAKKYDKIKLISKNQYKYGGYFYVADDKMLGLCRLYLNDVLVKVETLVTSSEI